MLPSASAAGEAEQTLPALGPAPAAPAAPAATALETSEWHALRADMDVLLWKLDQIHEAMPATEPLLAAARQLEDATRDLPEQIAAAISIGVSSGISAALEKAMVAQGELARQMLGQFERRLRTDIARLQENLWEALRSQTGPEAVSVSDLDARFKWLVDAMSDRFVALGNEIASIQRQIAPEQRSEQRAAHRVPANGTTASARASASTVDGGTAPTNGTAPANGAPVTQSTRRDIHS